MFRMVTLWYTNLAMKHPPFIALFRGFSYNMLIFHCYVRLPEWLIVGGSNWLVDPALRQVEGLTAEPFKW